MTEADLETPYYLIDESLLLKNLEKIALLRQRSGAKSVLALKCFSTWAVFDLMKEYMDGTTSSSLYEARLGKEKFGKEVHAYSVAWSEKEIQEVKEFATKIIFNSISQLNQYYPHFQNIPIGLRINPGKSHSDYDLANPTRRYSRLGAIDKTEIEKVSHLLKGAMFHCNCDNDNFESFSSILDHIAKEYEDLLHKLEWVSLGGGIYFTKSGYPFDSFTEKLTEFSNRFSVQVYLEPGETAITKSGFFVTQVLDIVKNEIDIAIVDSAVETHMLDLCIYRLEAKMDLPQVGNHKYMITGRTCLAGDIFGTYTLPEKLEIGSRVRFSDAAGYTMVKKNWFNGVQMPSIAVKRLNGKIELIRKFTYLDFLNNLS
ncbi:MAG TPA: carboxynorspermidine decarboxylase [Leptospiraceae bacterium]|nr:carboxynorspermidine decarboxylase [Leptospiraceae bacterium]HMX35085.1 carboxynorspermidine decarboxylase [Leptospiraceae bacterium]HMY34024.1 carboxynorspermidine decarboxylase [Leptospiraceae bacterium]HMZ66322.1 carboxynorspermidine decarboxylase [Leptospiraceae bacterium]HNA09439.1 carboxynorspermidine decarboxylase [Leptospiraceae bacterium]